LQRLSISKGIALLYRKNIIKVGQEGSNVFSSFSEEESAAYCRVFNSVLANDPHVKGMLPVNPESHDIFPALRDGIALCKLVNLIEPKIDERAINIKDTLNVFQITENLNLAINTSKALGCTVVGINSTTIIEQKHTLILGLLWQIIKQVLMKDITLKNHPELVRLLKEGESIGELLKLPKEDILLRWFNHHLKNANYPKQITNFSSDIKDSEKYVVLLNQLNKDKCDLKPLDENDPTKRAQKMLDNSKKLGVASYITPKDVLNVNMNLIIGK
jgi:plastin-1